MNGFLTGFNNATSAGPLCEEPMQGACFIISHMSLVETDQEEKVEEESKDQSKDDTFGSFWS